MCGRNAASTNNNRCISGGSNLRGHWCRLCRKKREESWENAACTETVEPDILVIGSKWYELNGTTMVEEHKNALWELWNREAEYAVVQSHLLVYQSEMSAFEEGDVIAEESIEPGESLWRSLWKRSLR